MFRNRKISFIVGSAIAFVLLIMQFLPPFSYVGSTFDPTLTHPGLGVIHAGWILLIISLIAIVGLGVVGAVVMMQERFERIINVYAIIYNVALFLPFVFCLVLPLGDLMSLLALLEESVPDVFAESIIIPYPCVYVALFIAIAMPIASHFKMKKKGKKKKLEQPEQEV